MKEARKIKGLKSQIKILQGDVEALKIDVANKQREYHLKKNKINELQEEIERFEKNKNIKVSEHAIIRYFERVKGYDISAIEKEIVSEEIKNLVNELGGSGGYPNNGFKVLMKNYTVTTVIN